MKKCADCELSESGHRGRACPMGILPETFNLGCSLIRPRSVLKTVAVSRPALKAVKPPSREIGQVAGIVRLTLTGQIRGGKNNMVVTRTGRHFPKPEWAAWRDAKLREAKAQFSGWPITAPCRAVIEYWAGDRKRRDVPAIIDAIWHVLERGGLVVDDSLIQSVDFRGSYDKENPRAEITIYAN